ncbi:hypothetical protein HD806DRAFT_142257 [Xylariaceae sp. AK1471]|nr:hypothetical protein HD806DRAFT_142257 [Xylariaceae sp. AK1471]
MRYHLIGDAHRQQRLEVVFDTCYSYADLFSRLRAARRKLRAELRRFHQGLVSRYVTVRLGIALLATISVMVTVGFGSSKIRDQQPLLFDTPFPALLLPSTGALSALLSRPPLPPPPLSSPRRNKSEAHLWPLGPEAHRMNQQPLNKVIILFFLLCPNASSLTCCRYSVFLFFHLPMLSPSQLQPGHLVTYSAMS